MSLVFSEEHLEALQHKLHDLKAPTRQRVIDLLRAQEYLEIEQLVGKKTSVRIFKILFDITERKSDAGIVHAQKSRKTRKRKAREVVPEAATVMATVMATAPEEEEIGAESVEVVDTEFEINEGMDEFLKDETVYQDFDERIEKMRDKIRERAEYVERGVDGVDRVVDGVVDRVVDGHEVEQREHGVAERRVIEDSHKHEVTQHEAMQHGRQYNPTQQQHLISHAHRKKLPILAHAEEIVSTVKTNRITVIEGDTGCGKTTQVPRILLAHFPRLIVSLPTRMAAVSVAKRVAQELGVRVGGLVGYKARWDECHGAATRLLFVTDGILSIECMSGGVRAYDVVVIDEFHERKKNCDFVVAYFLERNMARLVVMSATKESGEMMRMLGAGTVRIAVRQHEITVFYLDDCDGDGDGEGVVDCEGVDDDGVVDEGVVHDERRVHASSAVHASHVKNTSLVKNVVSDDVIKNDVHASLAKNTSLVNDVIAPLIKNDVIAPLIKSGVIAPLIKNVVNAVAVICRESSVGDILVFLPGIDEVDEVERLINGLVPYDLAVLKLTSSLSMAAQMRVFEAAAPRRVVLSAGVAELSVALVGLAYVVDSGLVSRRVLRGRAEARAVVRISKAQARQRAGRVGRAAPGFVFRMYTHGEYAAFGDEAVPEAVCSDAAGLVLKFLRARLCFALSMGLLGHRQAGLFRGSLTRLLRLGCIDARGGVTALGAAVCGVPLRIEMCVALLKSLEHGVFSEVAMICAVLCLEALFVTGAGMRGAVEKTMADNSGGRGDLVSYLNIFLSAFRQNFSSDFCRLHCIRQAAIKEAFQTFRQLGRIFSVDIYAVRPSSLQRSPNHEKVVLSFCEGYLLNVARRHRGYYVCPFNRDERLRIDPSSSLFSVEPDLLIYERLKLSTSNYMMNCCAVTPSMLLKLDRVFRKKAN